LRRSGRRSFAGVRCWPTQGAPALGENEKLEEEAGARGRPAWRHDARAVIGLTRPLVDLDLTIAAAENEVVTHRRSLAPTVSTGPSGVRTTDTADVSPHL
jgi:hypothetical protein